jgi:hypothetical protein
MFRHPTTSLLIALSLALASTAQAQQVGKPVARLQVHARPASHSPHAAHLRASLQVAPGGNHPVATIRWSGRLLPSGGARGVGVPVERTVKVRLEQQADGSYVGTSETVDGAQTARAGVTVSARDAVTSTRRVSVRASEHLEVLDLDRFGQRQPRFVPSDIRRGTRIRAPGFRTARSPQWEADFRLTDRFPQLP